MNVQYYTDPWPHVVIDDFLPDYIFKPLVGAKKKITEISNKYFNSERQTRYYVSNTMKAALAGEKRIPAKDESDYDIKNVDDVDKVKYIFHKAGIYDILIEYNLFIKEHDDVFRDIYGSLSLGNMYGKYRSGLQIQSPGYIYPIHPEAATKLMSLITFISPEDNHGTWLYNSNKLDYYSPTKKIEWKQNSAFIFCGIPNTTWHSFSAKKDISEKRITLGTFFYAKNRH